MNTPNKILCTFATTVVASYLFLGVAPLFAATIGFGAILGLAAADVVTA